MSFLYLRALVAVIVVGMLAGAILCVELGRQMGWRRVERLGPEALEGFGAVEGAVFGLLGLLIAFTFSAAATRFDARRDLVVKEANRIGTAYRRLDLLPEASQPALRAEFREYLDARLAVYARIEGMHYPKAEMARVTALQDRIWNDAVAACRAPTLPQTMLLLLPAINEMLDITTDRMVAIRAHVPWPVIVLLLLLMLACSILAGYGMAHVRSRSWTHTVAFAAILALTIYVTLDYEFPRLGLIRLDWVDRVLRDVRASMS